MFGRTLGEFWLGHTRGFDAAKFAKHLQCAPADIVKTVRARNEAGVEMICKLLGCRLPVSYRKKKKKRKAKETDGRVNPTTPEGVSEEDAQETAEEEGQEEDREEEV
jgi:hypothetical protein